MGLTLFAKASMDLKYWWEAFSTTTYLLNRLHTPVLNHKSPYEQIFHQPPDYYLRTFGCACYPCLRPYSRHKFHFRTSLCIFLGYSPYHKGYKCLHSSGRVYIARSVTFDETQFAYPLLFPISSTSPSSPSPPPILHPLPFPSPSQPLSSQAPLVSTTKSNSNGSCYQGCHTRNCQNGILETKNHAPTEMASKVAKMPSIMLGCHI